MLLILLTAFVLTSFHASTAWWVAFWALTAVITLAEIVKLVAKIAEGEIKKALSGSAKR